VYLSLCEGLFDEVFDQYTVILIFCLQIIKGTEKLITFTPVALIRETDSNEMRN
jgi:hypothetical protein